MVEDYEKIVASNWYTNFGPYERELSSRTALYIGESVFATTVANCTLGIEIAINYLFDKQRKKAIMPSFTFAAGPEILIRNGFTPLFIDIETSTLQPSSEQARAILECERESIAGILLCNIFGVGNENIEKWENLAKEFDVPLVIDSAAGFGSRYDDDERIGGRGDCEIFSLHATKPFAIGEGGLITSKNEKLINGLRSMQNFGFEADRMVHRIGTNAKLQELSCAIGIRQLDKLQARITERQRILSLYMRELEPAGYTFQDNALRSTVAFATIIAPSSVNADIAATKLLDSGIEARRYYTPALHQQAAIGQLSESVEEGLSVTEQVVRSVLSLPVLEDMTEDDIRYICDILINLT